MKHIALLSPLLLPLLMSGQNSLKRTSHYFQQGNYPKVVERLAHKKHLNTASLRQLATSYQMAGNYQKADSLYALIVAAPDKTAEDVYNYSQVLKENGKYTQAQQQLDAYAASHKADSRVQLNQVNKNYTAELLKDKGQFTISNLAINSKQQDFGVVYFNNDVVYTSSQHKIGLAQRIWTGNNLPYLDLYQAKAQSNGELSDSKKISTLDKKYHEGPASFTKDGSHVMYTRNNYKAKSADGLKKLELVESSFKDGKWGEKVAFPLNNKDYSIGHPAYSADGKTLYFASDMPGGKGGTDLYRIARNSDGTWGKAENLGDKINTEGNEMFPFVHESGLFFFSSDGRPGLGGLDVFATEIKTSSKGELQFSKVINVGVPVNSSKDDFSMVLNADKTKGYFASNREGGKGSDDIYSYQLLKPFQFGKTIKGTATDKEGNILANTTVNLYDQNKKLVNTLTTNETGAYTFNVEQLGMYHLTGAKEKYLNGSNSATVSDKNDTETSDLILEKDPGLSLLALVTDASTKQPLEGVKMTIVDALTGKEITNVITPATGDFKKLLNTNKVGDKLNYKIKLEKEGYLTKELVFNHSINKAGNIQLDQLTDLSMSKLQVGGDLASMIDIKPIYFDLGKATIRKDAATELDKIVSVMNQYPNMVVELGSHTDCRGNMASNRALSDKRAKASASYIKKSITKPERIYGKGYGESKLKNNCACEGTVKSTCSEEEHQQNRRTEFIIIKLK